MRYLFLLAAVQLPLLAQKAEGDQPVLQALLSEVQQLRMAIERSTLLGARIQLALTELQLQEATATRVSQQLNDARQQGQELSHRRQGGAARLKEVEDRLPSIVNAEQRRDAESEIQNIKLGLEEFASLEQQRIARESELANQSQAAQNHLAESRARISEMERSLDAAIQQLIQKH